MMLPLCLVCVCAENVAFTVYTQCTKSFTYLKCALAAIGSLSKGSDDNVRSLVSAGLIQVLLAIITNPSTDSHLIEICLCVVRSIYEHSFAPKEIINTNLPTLVYLIGMYAHGAVIHSSIHLTPVTFTNSNFCFVIDLQAWRLSRIRCSVKRVWPIFWCRSARIPMTRKCCVRLARFLC